MGRGNRFVPPEVCPVCGEDVPRSAMACPECGADERSGWKDEASTYDGLDLPDEAWGDGPGSGRDEGVGRWLRRGVVVLLLLVVIWWAVGR